MELLLIAIHPTSRQALTQVEGTPDRYQYTGWFLGKSLCSS